MPRLAAGLPAGAFARLRPAERRRLITLMARIAERAYRRGVQQGVTLAADPRRRDRLDRWRYGPSLDLAPGADTPCTTSSVERLFMECGELRGLGFAEPADARGGWRCPVWHGYSPARRAELGARRRTAEGR